MKPIFLFLLPVLVILFSCEEKRQVRVAMAQIFCLDGDRSGNFVRIEHALKEASAGGAEIVCFPETAILGWVNSDAHQRAFPIPGADSDRLGELADKYNVYICIGLAEKNGDRLHDTVILIDREGNLLSKHRKINILTELMTPPYTPGDEVGVVETEYGRIGMLICADTFHENRVKEMKDLEPGLVLVPYGWAAPEEDWPGHAKSMEDVVRKTATTTGCPVVGTDLVGEITKGPWSGQVYGGQSIAIDGNGKVLARAKDRDRDIVLIDIPLEKSSSLRGRSPWESPNIVTSLRGRSPWESPSIVTSLRGRSPWESPNIVTSLRGRSPWESPF